MNRVAVILLLFSGLLVSSASAQSGSTRPRQNETKPPQTNQTQTPNDDNDVLKVETSLVTIPVSVFDNKGRFISTLTQKDFKIFEEGKEQEIGTFGTTEQPITVTLILDTSPSTELRIDEIQNAAIAFVNQLKPNDKVMVVEFDANAHVLSQPTSDRAKLQKAIRKADFGDGTALWDTLDEVINRRLKTIDGRKAIVVFTDGVDTASYKTDELTSLQIAEKSGVPVYVAYYNTINDYAKDIADKSEEDEPVAARGTTPKEYEEGRRYLLELTQKTGGIAFEANGTQLDKAFSSIAEELRRLYSIGYYPAEAGSVGQRRQIKVSVNVPNVTVRARESYIVGQQENRAVNTGKKRPN